jgi:hypothetical protein
MHYLKQWTVEDYLTLWRTGQYRTIEQVGYNIDWTIARYASALDVLKTNPYDVSHIHGNLLLNEGITALLNLLTGGAETAFNNAGAYIGVGDSNTAASASQTGLQAASNKTYKAMQATYPIISSQSVTFRSQFTTSEANYAWEEFTIANGNSDSADNLNRKVSAQGTKASGQTWTIDAVLTFS